MLKYLLAIRAVRIALWVLFGTHVFAYVLGRWSARGSGAEIGRFLRVVLWLVGIAGIAWYVLTHTEFVARAVEAGQSIGR